MRRLIAALAVAASLPLALPSCGGASPVSTLRSIAYGDPAAPYLGMSKAEVIACAGQPHSRYEIGAGAETLTYRYTGAGPVPQAPKKSEDKKSKKPFGGSKPDGDWTCSASLVFENGRLIRVSFAHREVRSPYAWQSEEDPKKQEEMRREGVPTCAFSLPGCRRDG